MNIKQKRYFEFLGHLPAETQDKSLIAIKGHLLLEIVLREYIYERVRYPDRLRNKNINFANLIDFASSLEDNNSIQWVWQALRNANKIRNQLAHSLSPEKLDLLVATFVEYVIDNDGLLTVETTEELNFDKLHLAYFQLYDVIISSIKSYDVPDTGTQPIHSSDSLEETYRRVVRAIKAVERAGKLESQILRYGPQRSKNARKVW